MKRIFAALLVAPALIISCYVAPRPVFRLQPLSYQYDTAWLHGKEYAKLSGENTDLIIAFDEARDGVAAFDVEFVNRGTEAIAISSSLFTGYFLDGEQQVMNNSRPQKAIDPEEKLLEVDKAISREDARYAGEAGTKGLSALFDMAGDMASIGEAKSDEELEKEAKEDARQEIRDIEDENRHSSVVNDLTNEKNKWSFSALRKTTVPPGYRIRGKIFFWLISNSGFLKMTFDRESENLTILFKINKYKAS